jgi:serine/tyrosine/threonine adenylyltransferase
MEDAHDNHDTRDARDALATLDFDNRFIAELPGDPDASPRPRQVFGAAWSPVDPTPVAAPRLLAHSREAAALLGLSASDVASERFARVFGGNDLLPGMKPWAAAYGGHQFGHWAGQLGDGRAISLGEAVNAGGERWELQLKGAGPTPYSRTADGRAVLRSSIREFLCSEAMHHLGIPTTRALSLVGTGESVIRDVMYDGNPAPEPGAVVCRMAPSFLRLGNYELFASRGETELLEQLVDFTIDRDFPHLVERFGDAEGGGSAVARSEASAARRAAWFAEVCERTADLMVHWMRVGFVHGVMNTDNLSVLGLTIDYGPYGWLDDFDPDWTPNTTDIQRRRYRYGHQPAVAQWNLTRFAESLRGVFDDVAPLEAGLAAYVERYNTGYLAMTAAKLGLGASPAAGGAGAVDGDRVRQLVRDLHDLLHRAEMDYTLTFRALGELAGELGSEATADPSADEAPWVAALAEGRLPAQLTDVFYNPEKREAEAGALVEWLGRWREALGPANGPETRAAMHRVNPKYVLRNWLAQEAIDLAEAGDLSRVLELLEAMRRPYADQPAFEHFAARRPEWARHKVGCSMLSCSS